MNSEMQAIMARRRKKADAASGEGQDDTSAHDASVSHHSEGGRDERVASSPVKAELKAVEMSSDLQEIMRRRRGLLDDDDDDNRGGGEQAQSSQGRTERSKSGSPRKSSSSNDRAKASTDTTASPPPRRSKRHVRRHSHEDDISVDHSVESHGSSEGSAGSPKRKSSSRGSRRASVGALPSSNEPSTSLKSLEKSRRRASTAGGSRSGDSSDDCSRADSVSSYDKDGKRKSGSRRSGRRRPSHDESAEVGERSTRRTRSSDSQSLGDSSDDGARPPVKPHRGPETKQRQQSGKSQSISDDRAGWSDMSAFPSGESDFGAAFAAFPVDSTAKNKIDAGGVGADGFASSSSGFGNFDDMKFSPTPAAKTTAKKASSLSDSSAFDAGFGAFDAGFRSSGGAFGGDKNPFASQPQPSFEQPEETVWDATPLTDVPVRTESKLELSVQPAFAVAFQGRPIVNPLNGNVIFCSMSGGGAFLHEIDPSRNNLQVASTPVISTEMQRRLAAKYNVSAFGLEDVVSLTAGIHCANGQARLRVGAILDLRVLETNHVMRVAALWQWGYASPSPISLQFVMIPPSGGEFTYDPKTFQVADNIMFMAGASPKGPCVFMCKPTVRETWSANFLTGSGKVTAMSVSLDHERSFPFLAVALSDGTVSLWTYRTAVTGTANKANEPSKRWLFPQCRFETTSLGEAPPTSFDDKSGQEDAKNAGICTHLAWIPSLHSVGSLSLLAASFQNGVAVFNVGLPVIADKKTGEYRPLPEPNQTTQIQQTPIIGPLSIKRWRGKHERAFSAWLALGPASNLCLVTLLHSKDRNGEMARVVLSSMRVPLYRRGPPPKERKIAMDFLTSTIVPSDSSLFPVDLLQSSAGGHSVLCASQNKLVKVSPSPSGSVALDLRFPVASIPPGVNSTGDILLSDTASDKDGVLHIFTVDQCERQKSPANPNLHDWSRVRRRHWLCRTLIGDTKSTAATADSKDGRGFGGDDIVTGGASSDMICELFDESLEGFSPCRIVRCPGTDVCAVLYRLSVCSKSGKPEGFSEDASRIAVVDFSGSASAIHVRPGRDLAFFPYEGSGNPAGVILGEDGSTLSSFSWDSSKRMCNIGSSSRPIIGVDTDENYVECRRVFAFSGASMTGLVVVGTRHRDSRSCLVSGDLCSSAGINQKSWKALVPNIVTGRSLYFEDFEHVFSVIGLEHDDSGYRNFAVATSRRVLVVSAAMEISGSTCSSISSDALAPLGSFAVAFCSSDKVRYLSCLEGRLATGVLSTLPPKSAAGPCHLVAIRPDRVLTSEWHSGVRLVEHGTSPNTFLLPTAVTRPALLLEPLVANAICVGGKQPLSTPILRTVIEKFGRKMASITHGDEEGVGNIGAGLTPRTFEMLQHYGLAQAASWLLTGTVLFDRAASSKILPPWLPVGAKANGCLNADAFLHLVANGDQYFSEYIKAPDDNVASSLPRPSGPSAYISHEHALSSLADGRPLDAVKMLDLVGSESSENLIVTLALALSKDGSKNVTPILKSICGYDDSGFSRSTAPVKSASALAALAVSCRVNTGGGMQDDQIHRWMKPLAPSLRRGSSLSRPRQKILSKADLTSAGEVIDDQSDPLWVSSCNESKHVWNEGPRREKENLLMLDEIEDWLGRKRPVILGKEGASAAQDGGEKLLADILNKTDEDSFGGKSDLESETNGWVDGVGEGRSDEANLSAYFRMSEGEDEDSPWRSEGLSDITSFQNKAIIVGANDSFTLQETTSSVDEGEPGKVKALFDLVFEKSGEGLASGLAISAHRGGSVDIGVLHRPEKTTRLKCSLEFWYYLPDAASIPADLVLVRRTMGPSGDDLSKACLASHRDCVLWEIVLKQSGELEFRCCTGTGFLSSQNYDPGAAAAAAAAAEDDSDTEIERKDIVKYGRWNHVCIVLTSRDSTSVSACSVAMYMKGEEVAAKDMSMIPPGFDENDLDSAATLDDIMKKSYVVFGLNHAPGFRLTEIRVWACQRSAEDTQSLLYEYLTAAEAKKKFKVKISKKGGGKVGAFGGGLLAGPKTGLEPKRGMMAPTKSMMAPSRGLLSLAPPPKKDDEPGKLSLAPPPRPDAATQSEPSKPETTPNAGFEAKFGQFGQGFGKADNNPPALAEESNAPAQPAAEAQTLEEGEEDVPVTLWDSALPLSQQVRSSAAAALIRGPPAARHFGGNRGGLPDFIGMERFGVGGIAICGSEKTIVWRDNEDPPALTYPIGASGAIVSDLMDDEGSEFLCCFLAKEKRMVVFELQSRTIVVEIQMTTKLNFWRYLPPEAAENTLCFMLITPVGGFHWMPLEESPRPHQVWKRGAELQGKKVVNYEEGGSNGLDGPEIMSRVGLVMVTKAAGGGALEAWIVPVGGDSQAGQVSDDVMGACLCQPPFVEDGPFLPLLLTVHQLEEGIYVNVISVTEPKAGSVQLGEIEVSRVIEDSSLDNETYEPPDLAMGSFPEALCCSIGNIVVVIVRRKGMIAAFELEEDDLSLIALESVGHYVIDAVMRYSSEVGGAEIVMLLSDGDNPRDGRMVSFCFRASA